MAVAFTFVVAPVGLMVAALTTGVAEAAGCQPAISSVQETAATFHFEITGSCFGTADAWTAQDRDYLRISDLGTNAQLPNSFWNACWTGDPGTDAITCAVSEWSDRRIVVEGFSGLYGQGSYALASGEHVAFQVWNAQTHSGPAISTITYSPATSGQTAPPPTTPLPKTVTPHEHNAHSTSITRSLSTPLSAFRSVRSDIINATIAVGAALFITFPANLFNTTFEENYADIRAWWRRRFGWLLRKPKEGSTETDETASPVRWSRLAIVVIGGALLGGFLDPDFGMNARSFITVFALATAISIGIVVPALVAEAYHRARHAGTRMRVRALPAGLAIGAVCVLVSRISGFRPGYLYGVVAGVAFGRALAKREQAHLVALSTLAVIAASVAAWFAWAAINPSAQAQGASDALIWLDDVLAAVFIAGLIGSVIGMMPIRFLPGHILKSWHLGAWAAIFTVSLFGLVQVLLRPHETSDAAPTHAPLVTTIALFAAFALATIAFRWHFVRKRLRAEASEHADMPWQKTMKLVLGREAEGAVQVAATTDGVSIVDLTEAEPELEPAAVPAQRAPRKATAAKTTVAAKKTTTRKTTAGKP